MLIRAQKGGKAAIGSRREVDRNLDVIDKAVFDYHNLGKQNLSDFYSIRDFNNNADILTVSLNEMPYVSLVSAALKHHTAGLPEQTTC
jgi:hypothetical protein